MGLFKDLKKVSGAVTEKLTSPFKKDSAFRKGATQGLKEHPFAPTKEGQKSLAEDIHLIKKVGIKATREVVKEGFSDIADILGVDQKTLLLIGGGVLVLMIIKD